MIWKKIIFSLQMGNNLKRQNYGRLLILIVKHMQLIYCHINI